MLKECRWCNDIVDNEECFATITPVVGGDRTIWICDCGKIVPDDQDDSFNASNS